MNFSDTKYSTKCGVVFLWNSVHIIPWAWTLNKNNEYGVPQKHSLSSFGSACLLKSFHEVCLSCRSNDSTALKI